jgi:REP element-mobilizing transposase RayT
LLADAKKHHWVKIFGFCLMPHHSQLVLEPAHQTALNQFMQWLLRRQPQALADNLGTDLLYPSADL